MNKRNKLLFLSHFFFVAVCIPVCFLVDNYTASGQPLFSLKKDSSIIHFISLNNSSSSGNNSEKGTNNHLIQKIAPLIALIPSVGIIALQKVQIDKIKDDSKRLKEKHEDEITEIKKNLEEKYNSDEYTKQHNRDFVALVYEEVGLGDIIVESNIFEKSYSENEKEIKLQECLKDFNFSREAVNGLLHSKIIDGKEKKLLKAIVYDVIEKNFPGISEADFEDKCMHLYSYLKGWLICSIRYKTTNLPTEWIKNKALKKSEIIQVLQDTKYLILNKQKVSDYIPKEESRKLICEYIDILIKKVGI